MSETRFSDRLRKYWETQGRNNAKVGRHLGVEGSYIGRLLREEKQPSDTLVLLFERLEQEAKCDPFLSACEQILTKGDEQLVRGFLVNIYGLLAHVPGFTDESKRLELMVMKYMEEWIRRRARISSGG